MSHVTFFGQPYNIRQGFGALLLWSIWLAWVSLWWNRGFYPYDEGMEAVMAYQWMHGIRPFVDFYGSSPLLTGTAYYALLNYLFGFEPWVWRLGFVFFFGLQAWLIYRLLLTIVPVSTAIRAVIPLYFIVTMLCPPWWDYNLLGVFFSVLATIFLIKYFLQKKAKTDYVYLLLASFSGFAAWFSKPTYGLAIYFAWIVASALLFKNRKEKVVKGIICLILSSILFWILLLAFFQMEGMLSGFLRTQYEVFTYPFKWGAGSKSGGIESLLDGTLHYYYQLWKQGVFLFLLAILAVLGMRWYAKKVDKFWANIEWFFFGIIAVVILCLLAVYPRQLIAFIFERRNYIFIYPLIATVLFVAILYDNKSIFKTKDPSEDNRNLIWLIVLLIGSFVCVFHALEKRNNLYGLLQSSTLLLPIIWAYIDYELPRKFKFRWPKGLLLLILIVVCLLGVSVKVTSPHREKPWWAGYEYFNYPNLRYLKASNARELDYILTEARKVVEKGGYFYSYPGAGTFYPLAETTLPTKIPWVYPRWIHSPPIHEWEYVKKQFEKDPPELIIVQVLNMPSDVSLFPSMLVEVLREQYLNQKSKHYDKMYQGKRFVLYKKK